MRTVERKAKPHRPTGVPRRCCRCGHSWPCPSTVAGFDLPQAAPCGSHSASASNEQAARAELAALELIYDTGMRRGAEPLIVWAINPRVEPFIEEVLADLGQYGQSPDEEDIRTVLEWLSRHPGLRVTREELSLACAVAVGMPSTHAGRCLFWAEVFGFLDGPT